MSSREWFIPTNNAFLNTLQTGKCDDNGHVIIYALYILQHVHIMQESLMRGDNF